MSGSENLKSSIRALREKLDFSISKDLIIPIIFGNIIIFLIQFSKEVDPNWKNRFLSSLKNLSEPPTVLYVIIVTILSILILVIWRRFFIRGKIIKEYEDYFNSQEHRSQPINNYTVNNNYFGLPGAQNANLQNLTQIKTQDVSTSQTMTNVRGEDIGGEGNSGQT